MFQFNLLQTWIEVSILSREDGIMFIYYVFVTFWTCPVLVYCAIKLKWKYSTKIIHIKWHLSHSRQRYYRQQICPARMLIQTVKGRIGNWVKRAGFTLLVGVKGKKIRMKRMSLYGPWLQFQGGEWYRNYYNNDPTFAQYRKRKYMIMETQAQIHCT